jgi:hypothetical protein
MYRRGNTPFLHVYEANKLFTKHCCCTWWTEVVTEFMLSFLGWNTGSIHTCQCSYKKMCWVRVSVSGCLTDGSCSIICNQIQNDMAWKICLKLYIQANETNWLFYLIKISSWGLFDLKWTMVKKNIHNGRSVKIAEWRCRHNLGKKQQWQEGGAKSTMGIKNIYLWMSHLRKQIQILEGHLPLTPSRLHLWMKRLIRDTKFLCLLRNVYRNRITEKKFDKIISLKFSGGNDTDELLPLVSIKTEQQSIVQFINVFYVYILS